MHWIICETTIVRINAASTSERKNTMLKTLVLQCFSCGWTPQAGQVIKCDSVKDGPWYCPTCGEALPEVTLDDTPAETA